MMDNDKWLIVGRFHVWNMIFEVFLNIETLDFHRFPGIRDKYHRYANPDWLLGYG